VSADVVSRQKKQRFSNHVSVCQYLYSQGSTIALFDGKLQAGSCLFAPYRENALSLPRIFMSCTYVFIVLSLHTFAVLAFVASGESAPSPPTSTAALRCLSVLSSFSLRNPYRNHQLEFLAFRSTLGYSAFPVSLRHLTSRPQRLRFRQSQERHTHRFDHLAHHSLLLVRACTFRKAFVSGPRTLKRVKKEAQV